MLRGVAGWAASESPYTGDSKSVWRYWQYSLQHTHPHPFTFSGECGWKPWVCVLKLPAGVMDKQPAITSGPHSRSTGFFSLIARSLMLCYLIPPFPGYHTWWKGILWHLNLVPTCFHHGIKLKLVLMGKRCMIIGHVICAWHEWMSGVCVCYVQSVYMCGVYMWCICMLVVWASVSEGV